jgi:hypothetical protein
MKTRTGFSLALLATAILLLCQLVRPALSQDQGQAPPEPPNASQQAPAPPDAQANGQMNDQAQPDQGQPEQDPPTRAGRISDTEGSVSFQPGGQGDWLDAVRNRPLTVGDNLWVDKDSRAEIQIGGTSIRLGPETSVTFLDLSDNVIQLRLSLGSLFFRVRHLDNGESFEVDTPNLAFNVNQPGEFRLDANQNGDQTIATVWHGAAEVTGGGNSYRLGDGQQGTFSGTDQLSYDVGEIQQPDSFSQWCLSRDQQEDRIQSRQYVSDDMTGYEDLDQYGQWRNVPDYGNVWTPTGIPGDWAPYRYGHWAYVYPWGWTWVEDEPWGFAPFHYGRWAFVGGGWGWVPGPVAVRPVYAPALVAFVGGFSIGVGTAPVGWFPLGPREVFVPWYRTSPRYVENVNITNTRVTVVQVNNVYHNYSVNHVTNVTYVNRNVRNSVTVVNHDTFVNARPVDRNIAHVDARQLASARVMPGDIQRVQPARQSVMGVSHPVQFRPPAQALSRPVVATRQPANFSRPAAGGAAFGRPAAPAPVRTVRAAPPAKAQALQRGARGGAPNNGAARAPSPNNAGARGEAPNNAGRPGAPQPNTPQNRNAVPRPGASAAQPNSPENRGAAPRSGAPTNNEAGQRSGAPTNNHNVPRPPSATPQSEPAQQPRQYPGTRPENNRPQETPQAQPSRPAETPQAKPEQPSRAPQNREEPAPRQPETRQQATPSPRETERNNPRPQARPAEPSARAGRAPAPKNEKPSKPPKEEKPPKDHDKH